jgi:hypothetical protein
VKCTTQGGQAAQLFCYDGFGHDATSSECVVASPGPSFRVAGRGAYSAPVGAAFNRFEKAVSWEILRNLLKRNSAICEQLGKKLRPINVQAGTFSRMFKRRYGLTPREAREHIGAV